MARRQTEQELNRIILRRLEENKIAKELTQALEDHQMLGPVDQLINDVLGRTEIGDLPTPPSPPKILIMESLEPESPGSRERVEEELKGVRRRRGR